MVTKCGSRCLPWTTSSSLPSPRYTPLLAPSGPGRSSQDRRLPPSETALLLFLLKAAPSEGLLLLFSAVSVVGGVEVQDEGSLRGWRTSPYEEDRKFIQTVWRVRINVITLHTYLRFQILLFPVQDTENWKATHSHHRPDRCPHCSTLHTDRKNINGKKKEGNNYGKKTQTKKRKRD